MSTPVAPSMFGPRAGLLSRANPVVKLLGALLITLVIVVSADPVTNAVALAGQLVLLAVWDSARGGCCGCCGPSRWPH